MICRRIFEVTTVIGTVCAMACSETPAPTAPPAMTTPPAGVGGPSVTNPPPTTPMMGAMAGARAMPPEMTGQQMMPPTQPPAMPPTTPPAVDSPPMGGAPAMPPSEPMTGNCEGGSLMPGDTNMSVEIAGQNRSFIVHVPPMYDGSTPMPLMFNFHPLTGSASGQRSGSGWAQLGDTEGFITTFLNGIGGQWDLGELTRPGNNENDRMFAVAVLDMISKAGCVDMKRVYASGYSMGGGMTHYLGCREGAKFAAIAPSAFDLIEENQPCEPGRPLTVIMFRGMGDGVVPYQPSVGTLTGAPASFLGAEGCFEEWAMINGCTDEQEMIENDCRRYDECMNGVTVTLCQNGGHTQGDARISWDAIKDHTL
jgi:polyhydroxybutyrate depolymerase